MVCSQSLLYKIFPYYQLLNLSGDDENPHPSCLMGEAFDENFALEMKSINSKMAFLFMNYSELMVAYTYDNWSLVETTLPLIRKLEKESDGYFPKGYIFTWSAICHYELYLANGKRKHRREARRCHCQVQKWEASGTVILSGVVKLLDAVKSLCVKEAPMGEVETAFEGAFGALAANKNRFFEALANERLAKLYLGNHESAGAPKGRRYLERAIDLYTRWGAIAKAEWLKKRYGQSASWATPAAHLAIEYLPESGDAEE